MCNSREDCGCGYRGERYEGHHAGYGGLHGHRMDFGFPLMSIEEEVKTLEEIKEALEKRLKNVNKRLEILKR